MKGQKRIFSISIVILLGVIGYYGHKKAEEHVLYMTAGEPHSVNCFSCHAYMQRHGPIAKMLKNQYLSPMNMAVSPDGAMLYVTAQEGNKLLAVNLNNKAVEYSIDVGEKPHSVVLSKDGKTAYVSNQWSYNVFEIDLNKKQVTDTLPSGYGPAGLAIDRDNNYLYVANTYSSDISIFDLNKKREVRRLSAGKDPTGISISPDGKSVFVANRLSNKVPFRTTPMAEVTVFSTKSQRVTDRDIFPSANIQENVEVTPSGDLAIVTQVRPKNLIPTAQVEQGWMMNHGFGIIELKNGHKKVQFLTDEPNAFYADPYDVVISPDGKRAYISNSGADVISVIDLDAVRELIANATDEQLATYGNHLGMSSKFVIGRIHTGANPKGLLLSSDGKKLYVAERLDDKIAIIDTDKLKKTGNIDLGGPEMTVARRGQQLFHSAGHTFQGQYSCLTCHPDGHHDGLTWDMGPEPGRDLANTQTLLEIDQTSPFKWNGHNVSVFMQDGMRFSKFLTRTEVFQEDELNALVSYILTELDLPPNPNHDPSGRLTEAQKRGKVLFERTRTNCGRFIPVNDRCTTCHPAPLYTDRKQDDVGTRKAADDDDAFDTPSLNNVFDSPPYLHDGSAYTLEEIWTKFNDHDEHGYVNDMTKDQLNDLVEYLKSIGSSELYHDAEHKTLNASTH